jgi:hypothetical protein
MKYTTILFALLICSATQGQQYVAKAGKVHFFSTNTMENIEATTNNAVCVINTGNKKIVVKIRITSFKFKDGLMQEHFNENYMESDKYEYSTLDGVIAENIDFAKDGVYDVTIRGTLDIHGVKKDREIKGKLTIENGAPAAAQARFDVRLADHNIKIPALLGSNIAEVIPVDVDFRLEKYEKK